MCDTGLLVAMLEEGLQKDIMDGNLGIYNGTICENILADVFTKMGKKRYYCIPNRIEVDFFIRRYGLATATAI